MGKSLHMSKKSSTFAADFDNEDGFDCLQPRKKMLKLVPQAKTVACGFFCPDTQMVHGK